MGSGPLVSPKPKSGHLFLWGKFGAKSGQKQRKFRAKSRHIENSTYPLFMTQKFRDGGSPIVANPAGTGIH